MKRFGVYYYGAFMCEIEAESLSDAKIATENFIVQNVEGSITWERVKVFELEV